MKPAEPAAPVEVPIETCAAVAASIARRRKDTARILEENDLDPPAWAALKRRYNDAILDEARRGKAVLLKAYDAAYVGRLEQERGPIEVEEYARLVVAAERGDARRVLADLGLPETAMVRIERVWLDRVVTTQALGDRVRLAVSAARQA